MNIRAAVLVALILAGICAACGGGKNPSPSPTLYGHGRGFEAS